MKKIIFLLLFVSQISYAQSDAVSAVMEEVAWEQDSILSVYKWVTTNMSQKKNRSKRMKEGKEPKKRKGKRSDKKSKPKTEQQKEDRKIKNLIKRKKGTSDEIATLFNALVSELGYESQVIKGYAKNSAGEVMESGHSWNAVKVNGTWKLYDPTWGGGAIVDRKYVRNYDEAWYDANPAEMIKGHMPFDPVWQLLGKPVSYSDFDANKATKMTNGDFDFNQKLKEYFNSNEKRQLQSEYDRSSEMGEGNEAVIAYQDKLFEKIENYDTANNKKLLEQTQASYSDVASQFDLYKKAKKNKFIDKKWNRKNSRKVLGELQEQLNAALNTLDSMEMEDAELIKSANKSIDYCDKYLDKVEKEIEYMDSLTPLKMNVGKRND